jgi:hypothetical protein
MVCRSLHQHMAKRAKLDLERSNGVPASAPDRTWCDRAQQRSNPRCRFERRSSQPASHAVALADPTIPLLPAMRRGGYLRSIAGCTIERMYQCDRTHGMYSNVAL